MGQTISLTAARRGKVNLQPVAHSAAPQSAAPKDRFDAKLRARAELIAAYAGLLGTKAVPTDILETMTASDVQCTADQPRWVDAALQSIGLITNIEHVQALTEDLWPAVAHMTSGQFILVVSQCQGELVIFDPSQTDNRAHVLLSEFEPFFTGAIVRAEAPYTSLEKTYMPDTSKPHWFWSEFGRFRKPFAEVALGSFVANLLAVSVALFSLQVYDRVIPHQSEATLWVLAIGALIALLMEGALKIARARLIDGAGRQIELTAQQILMSRILGMRSDAPGRVPSQLFSSMREFGSVREFFTASTVSSLADIPFIFLFLFMVSTIAGNVVWVLILGGVLMVIPSFFLQKRMMRLTRETQGASSKAGRLLHEAVFELDTIKTQRAEDRFQRIWSELTALSALKSSDQRKLGSVLTFWSQGIQQATYVSAVIFGTYLVFAGGLTVGSIIATGILTSRTLAPLTQLAGTMARWGNVKTALDGLDGIANAPQDADGNRTYLRRETLRGEFEFREVKFTYDTNSTATLDIPALMIRPGQKLAILGPNGSGKSTLLKLLSGLYRPASGSIMLDGADMNQIAPRDIRRLVGYLGQDVRLFAGTLRDNLNLNMLERDDARMLRALDFAGLGQFVRAHPKGLDLEISDGGQGLSVGQRQSVGWARLWLQDPVICLLDEPTAALDQTLETALVSRLEAWLEERTAVIATHRVPILTLADRTMILQNGRLAVDGPREQVLAHLAKVNEG